MRIDIAQVFKFTFTYEGAELMIPLAAPSKEEAISKLRNLMLGWANELVPATPTLSPMQIHTPELPPPDPFALQMRIEEMIRTLIPLKKPKGAQTVERLVKEWTGFPMEPENYPAIIAELGRLGPNTNG